MRMRKTTGAIVAIAMLFAAAPAVADAPISITDSSTFVDVNPCTEEPHEVTINFDVSLHLHGDREVVSIARSGSTDDGYTMIAGAESFVFNGNVARGAFVDQWRNDDGSKFMVHGNFLFHIKKDELLVDRFRLTCIGNG